ncbi:MAG: discoidin domain-containing protein [Polyangiaceae bacterium]|nr:discoidin domain-containing protein [Polyangiaceae bacterium]
MSLAARSHGLAVLGLTVAALACDSSKAAELSSSGPSAGSAPSGELEVAAPSASIDPELDEPPPKPKGTLPLYARAEVEVSSSYPGWPASNAVDGSEETSWYSGSNDSVAQGKKPFYQLTFKEPTPVRTVTILGNRDPAFFNGYAILSGQLDVFDASGRLVATITQDSDGQRHDFIFKLPQTAEGVRVLRFTSTRDEGKRNWWGDVAISEFQVE